MVASSGFSRSKLLANLDISFKCHERKMSVTCSLKKVTLVLHNHLPLCCFHIVLASLTREVANILNCSMHMVSMMWNGYFIYIKVKSRGEQSAANTELAGLCFYLLWKAELSPGRSNIEHLIALCGINNFFSSNRLRLNTVVSLFYHHKNSSSAAFGSVHSVTGVVSWSLRFTNQLLCSNPELRLSPRGLGSHVANMTNSHAEGSRGCRESEQL